MKLAECVKFLADNFEPEDFPQELGIAHPEDNFDPKFRRAELIALERNKLISINRDDPSNWVFRLTLKATSLAISDMPTI